MGGTQDKIRQLKEEIARLKSVEKHYQSSLNELRVTEKRAAELEKKLHEEYADVEALEKLTLKGIFHSILGNKETQLEQARQEYLQAVLQHNECKTTLETVQFEIRILKQKSELLKELELELASLQKIRENELIKEDSADGIQLRKLLDHIDELHTRSNRLGEIKNSGQVALKKMSMAALALQEAKNWGNWDMMHKRHRNADYYKHSAIDDAKQFAFDAKRALIAFERELGDIGLRLNSQQLDISSLSSFLDVFFDNLITDWIFQQKIKKTLANVNLIIGELKSVLATLDSRQGEIETALTETLKNKERILLKA